MATTLLDMVISTLNTAISSSNHAVVDTLTVNLLETLVVFSKIPSKVRTEKEQIPDQFYHHNFTTM